MHDVVSVNFRGRFVGGKEFVNTYVDKEPFAIPVANVIEGWKVALAQMPVGSKWELYIPPDLAYGPMGGNNIAPNKTLVYEIELVGVTKPPAAGGAAAARQDAGRRRSQVTRRLAHRPRCKAAGKKGRGGVSARGSL